MSEEQQQVTTIPVNAVSGSPVARSQSAPTTKLPKIWYFVGGAIAVGLLTTWVMGGRRETKVGDLAVDRPQEPILAVDPTVPGDIPDPRKQVRDTALKDAIAEVEAGIGSPGTVELSRRDLYIQKAQGALDTERIPLEVTLLRELNRQVREQTNLLQTGAEFGGSAEHVSLMRSLYGDAWAILDALRIVWGVQVPSGDLDARDRAVQAIGETSVVELEALGVSFTETAIRPISPDTVLRSTVQPAQLNLRMAQVAQWAAVVGASNPTHQIVLEEPTDEAGY